MMDILLDALIDTLKLMPYLLVTFLLLEYLEHKLNKKNEKALIKYKKYGPVIGGFLGGLPQCGFGSMAASLFSNRVITIGTVISIFLATSDEMLPIMIGEQMNILTALGIIGSKVIIGIIIGLVVDFIYRKNTRNSVSDIHKMCEEEHCECESDGILVSSIKHTLKISLFILIANIIIGLFIYYIGEDKVSNLLLHKNILTYFIASLIGLIPNCASSVIITKLYISNLVTIGTLMSGLLTGSGLGILILFRTNKNMKENLTVLSIIYFIGVVVGIIIDLVY